MQQHCLASQQTSQHVSLPTVAVSRHQWHMFVLRLPLLLLLLSLLAAAGRFIVCDASDVAFILFPSAMLQAGREASWLEAIRQIVAALKLSLKQKPLLEMYIYQEETSRLQRSIVLTNFFCICASRRLLYS